MKLDEAIDFATTTPSACSAADVLDIVCSMSRFLFQLMEVFRLGALKVSEGGMSSHGGIIGVMLVCWWYGRKHKIPILHLMDLVAFGGCIGFSCRIANLLTRTYGRAARGYSVGGEFPQEMYMWMQREVSKLFDLGGAAEALEHSVAGWKQRSLLTCKFWLGWVQTSPQDTAHTMQFNKRLKNDFTPFKQAMHKSRSASTLLTARYPSQLIQSRVEGFLFS